MSNLIPQILLVVIFLTVVFLHMSRKNIAAAAIYGVQSLAISILMVVFSLNHGTWSLVLIAFMTLIVKVIIAPQFFIKLVKKHELKFSASTYLNTPLTLIIVTALTIFAHTEKLSPLWGLVPANEKFLSLSLSIILISFFLIINRKGALSQIVGILSLENGIVAFALFAGLEQSIGLQMGKQLKAFRE